jgi:hypothetical protein
VTFSSIHLLVFIMETKCGSCEIGTEFSYIVQMNFRLQSVSISLLLMYTG